MGPTRTETVIFGTLFGAALVFLVGAALVVAYVLDV